MIDIFKKKSVILYALSVIFISVGFHMSYGLEVLNPVNINWLMSVYHDWGQHYLGWAYFANEPWHFPIGHIENYNYPAGINVGYTDSIPLLAIFFKLFKAILPETFQYLGAYIFISHILTGVYTIKILNYFKVSPPITLIASIITALSPLLHYRGIHPSTTAHWLILASLFLYLIRANSENVHRLNRKQVLLAILAALINPYLLVLVIGFNLILPLKHYLFNQLISLKQLVMFFFSTVILVLVAWLILGMITIGSEVSMGVSNGYGLYGMNLNSFFNPGGYSVWLPQLPYFRAHQYEGYAYLGLGLLLMTLIVAFIKFGKALTSTFHFKVKAEMWPLVVLIIGMILFAITHEITFNDHKLLEIAVPDVLLKLGNIFRASGRFVWPFYYCIILATIYLFHKMALSSWIKNGLLLFVLVIQLYDTQIFYTARELPYGDYDPKPLETKIWTEAFSNFDKIITYPPFDNHLVYNMDYQDLLFTALKESKPISTGYVARETTTLNKMFLDSINQQIQEERLDSTSLIVTRESEMGVFIPLIKKQKLRPIYIDGYYLLSPKKWSKELYKLAKVSGDSVLNALKMKTTPFEKQEVNYRTDFLTLNLEEFNYNSGVIKIGGWAFNNKFDSSETDTLLIVLKGENESYAAKLNVVERKDVATHFNNEQLVNCGFKSIVYTDNVKPGIYRVALGIKSINTSITAQLVSGKEAIVVE
jgi:hypothetical protein